MKSLHLLLLLFFSACNIHAQQGFRYENQFVKLIPKKTSFLFVQGDEVSLKQILFHYRNIINEECLFKIAEGRYFVSLEEQISDLYISKNLYFSELYYTDNDLPIIVLPDIIVCLHQGYDISAVLDDFPNLLVLKKKLFGSTYVLNSKVLSSYEILNLVDILSKRKEVKWCEPDMFSNITPNNPLYSQQYYLNNTGQNGGTAGIDIDIVPAWVIAKGKPFITVAVIDQGVDRNHPDLVCITDSGYTAGYPNEKGAPINYNDIDSKGHGTACAGIIGATDNTLGIKGVATGVKILPVNIFPYIPEESYYYNNGNYYSYTYRGVASNAEIAEAIEWAYPKADVLSCSWGGGSPSNCIAQAINNARNNGREGKGSIVVFASGNSYPSEAGIAFPANLDGVISVGAIDKNGIIWNYSQRGDSLDLVAPTGNINLNGDVVTTDISGNGGYSNSYYTSKFGGTSAACPQVAGVAALMLSVRPDLTEEQVRIMLQQTARDLGTTGFDTTYGYGLVDAYAAISAVKLSVSGLDIVCTQDIYTINNMPSGASVALNTSYSSSGFSILVSSNLSIVSYSNGSLTIQKVSDGKGYIKIYYKGYLAASKEIWVGAPVVNDVYYMGGNIYIDTDYEAGTDPRYCYIVINGIRYRLLGGMGVIPLSNGTYNVEAYVSNQCGESSHYFGQITITGSGLYSVGSISNNNQVTIENAGNIDSSQPIETSGAMTGKGAITVPYTLSNAQTGEVAAKGEMPIEGGVLDFGSVHGGLYVLTLLPQSSEPETFKIQLK